MALTVRERLKQQGHYTPFYCEENVYHLIKTLLAEEQVPLEKLQVVFVSNSHKTVPFWCQSASHLENGQVVWDYHVFLVEPSASLLWDLDTSLPCPTDLHRYIQLALHPETPLQPPFQRYLQLMCDARRDLGCRMYRVVCASDYLREFASDRRHMLQDRSWLAAPPEYACIKNERDECHTLDKFCAMHNDESWNEHIYGRILDERQYLLQMGYL